MSLAYFVICRGDSWIITHEPAVLLRSHSAAASNGHVEIAKLLAAKALVDIKDHYGWGPQPMSHPF